MISFVAALASVHELSIFNEAVEDHFLAADPNDYVLRNQSFLDLEFAMFMISVLIGFVVVPVFGWLIDKFGSRPLMLIGIATASIGFLLITQVQSDWHKDGAIAVISLGLGPATGIIIFGTIGKWFVRKRLLAFAIVTAGSTAAVLFSVPQAIAVHSYGWQAISLASGASLCIIGIPVAMVMRRQPEDHGLLPDGQPAKTKVQNGLFRATSSTLRTAIRLRAFWQINIAFALALAPLSAMSGSIDLRTTGLYDTRVQDIFVVGYASTFIQILAVIAIGIIGIYRKKTFLALSLFAVSIVSLAGLVVIMLVDDIPYEYFVFASLGLGRSLADASLLILQFTVLAEYFGTRSFGVILGASLAVKSSIDLVLSFVPAMFVLAFNEVVAYNVAVSTIGFVALAIAAILILKLEPQSRIAARIRLARRSNHHEESRR